jgi:hypothetical protein
MCVPCPGSLVTVSVPSTVAMRSASPARPPPADGCAPPIPSSSIVRTSRPAFRVVVTRAVEACAYFVTFVSASATAK